MNVVETEYHFLLVCPLYRELRLKYFKQYLCHWPNIYKFDSLMMSKTKSTILNLARLFCFQIKETSLQLSIVCLLLFSYFFLVFY